MCVFVELMRHRKATVVAARLGLTQSAISHALGRLRDVFGDPLFRRRPNGLEPTARALALEPRIAGIIALSHEALELDRTFNPGTAEGVFRLAAHDYESSVLAGPLTDVLRREAPGMRLSVRAAARRDALELLTDGRLDVAVGYFPGLSETFVAEPLYRENYAVVMRRGHPRAKRRLDLSAYLACSHVLVSIAGDFDGVVDQIIARNGHKRRVVVALPSFLPALAAVADTDLVATVPRRLAERHEKRFGLAVRKPPLAIRDFVVATLLHRRMSEDPAIAWLRGKIRALTV
jgi:DNA-binding transcriptional LysR family regulator